MPRVRALAYLAHLGLGRLDAEAHLDILPLVAAHARSAVLVVVLELVPHACSMPIANGERKCHVVL